MAIALGSNLNLEAQLPNFERDLFDSIAAMKTFQEDFLPGVFIAGNKEDGKYYIYNSSNVLTEKYGRWRPFNNTQVEEINSEISDGSIVQYIGETNSEYIKGSFYLVNSSKASIEYETVLVEGSRLSIDVKNSSKALDALNGKETGDYEVVCILDKGTEPEKFAFNGEEINTLETFGFSTSGRKILAGDKVILHYTAGACTAKPIGGSSGAGTAETTIYSNDNYPDYTNVELALDALFNKVYYVKPTCSLSAAPSGGTFEMGTTISAPITFTWNTNKDITSQTLTDCILENASIRTATYDTNITSDKTFTLSVSDGENSATSSVSYKFLNNIFWGSASIAETYDSVFISALSNKKLTNVIKGTYSFNIASGEYGFWAVPSNMTISSIWIGGFEVTVDDLGTVSYTNAQGYTRDYKLYKTGKASLGAISAEIK